MPQFIRDITNGELTTTNNVQQNLLVWTIPVGYTCTAEFTITGIDGSGNTVNFRKSATFNSDGVLNSVLSVVTDTIPLALLGASVAMVISGGQLVLKVTGRSGITIKWSGELRIMAN